MEPNDNSRENINLPEEVKDKTNVKKAIKSYTIKEKLIYLEIAVKNFDHFVDENFGIDRKNLRRWRNQKKT